MENFNFIVRNVECLDFYKGHLNLLEQLTTVNKNDITYTNYCDFINSLNNNHTIFVIENNNKIIATVTILIENKLIHCLGKVGHIEDVVVDKDFCGNNIGKHIITHAINYCKSNECYKTILDCDEKVSKFYEKCNFEIKGCMMAVYF